MTDGKALSEMGPSTVCLIVSIKTRNGEQLRKLASLGILPGIQIELVQNVPAFIIRSGHTQIAVDKEIADHIIVTIKK